MEAIKLYRELTNAEFEEARAVVTYLADRFAGVPVPSDCRALPGGLTSGPGPWEGRSVEAGRQGGSS
jgi:hypothetical protein